MPAEQAVTVGRQRIALICTAAVCVCVCVCVCACVCVRMSVCARVCACMRDVFAIYRQIIMKIIILYFIQIRHTDDFTVPG